MERMLKNYLRWALNKSDIQVNGFEKSAENMKVEYICMDSSGNYQEHEVTVNIWEVVSYVFDNIPF